jgi:hypothetical protein
MTGQNPKSVVPGFSQAPLLKIAVKQGIIAEGKTSLLV